MNQEGNQLQVSNTTQSVSAFKSHDGFVTAQRMATALSASTVVPKEYQGNVANCLVALELAHRVGVSPLMVMQNTDIIHGRPSWKSTFIIAAVNGCGLYAPLRFEFSGTGDEWGCVAVTTDLRSGEVVRGPRISIAMSKAEGWFGKSGSKWKTMPELMLQYRSAAFFGRLYIPHILQGMHSTDEYEDIGHRPRHVNQPSVVANINAQILGTDDAEIM
jgi:hypothetical protein